LKLTCANATRLEYGWDAHLDCRVFFIAHAKLQLILCFLELLSPSYLKVLGIDIDIREPNRDAIEKHPLSSRISMIEGSSIDPDIIRRVKHEAVGFNRIMVFLDSNHTYEHVLAELEAYSPLVSLGSYCVVFDTFVDDVPKETFTNRPWGPENNPKKAVIEFVKNNTNFLIDTTFENKLMITVAPGGFLQRI
jgi:cephalosporin hydroxylase